MHPTQEVMRQVFQPGQELHPLIPPLWTPEYDWCVRGEMVAVSFLVRSWAKAG